MFAVREVKASGQSRRVRQRGGTELLTDHSQSAPKSSSTSGSWVQTLSLKLFDVRSGFPVKVLENL